MSRQKLPQLEYMLAFSLIVTTAVPITCLRRTMCYVLLPGTSYTGPPVACSNDDRLQERDSRHEPPHPISAIYSSLEPPENKTHHASQSFDHHSMDTNNSYTNESAD